MRHRLSYNPDKIILSGRRASGKQHLRGIESVGHVASAANAVSLIRVPSWIRQFHRVPALQALVVFAVDVLGHVHVSVAPGARFQANHMTSVFVDFPHKLPHVGQSNFAASIEHMYYGVNSSLCKLRRHAVGYRHPVVGE